MQTYLEKCSIILLSRQDLHCSEWVPSEWVQNSCQIICLEMLWTFCFVLNGAWSVHISLLIQIKLLFHWRKQYYGLVLQSEATFFRLKMMDLFLSNTQLSSSQDVNWWTGVVWITCGLCDVFISCLDSHSDGTHSLQRIHWRANDVMLHFSKSVQIKKQKLIYILDGLRGSTFSAKKFGSTILPIFVFVNFVHILSKITLCCCNVLIKSDSKDIYNVTFYFQ